MGTQLSSLATACVRLSRQLDIESFHAIFEDTSTLIPDYKCLQICAYRLNLNC